MQRTTYRVKLAYDGRAFAGFSQQPAARTVESTLLDALRPLVPELPALAVAARTDRGVHALGQVVSFWSRAPLGEERLRRAIDAAAPDELCALEVRQAPRRFHASFSAAERSYTYFYPDGGMLDADRLDRLLEPLLGRRCFGAFARDTPAGASMTRRLIVAQARRTDVSHVRFDFTADGFLRHQVRVLVATAVREARSGAQSDALLKLSKQGERRATARPADPDGLYLVRVRYHSV